MITGLQHLHSFLPYLLLTALLVSSILFLTKAKTATFSASDKRLALITLILSHLQLIIGLALYFLGPKGYNYTSVEGFMKDPVLRLYAVEHISVMLIAIALITVGYSRAKRAENDHKKFRSLGIFYGLGLILALSRIPWDAWLA